MAEFGCQWRTEYPYGDLTPLCNKPELVYIDRSDDKDGCLNLCSEHLVEYVKWWGKPGSCIKVVRVDD